MDEMRDYGGRGFARRAAPVNVGDEFDVTIEAVGEKGDGIAKKEGFVIFVPNTNQGDNVKIRVSKVLRKVGFADVIGQGGDAPADEPREDSPDGEKGADSGEEPKAEESKAEEKPQDTEDFGEEIEEKK